MYTVTISERGKPPVKLDFDKPEITIGRVRGNDIVLQKNNVSKRHAKLVVKDGQFIIIDQKSTNGTIVNARKITAPQVVREDDKICIGDFILTLKHDDRPVVPAGPPPMAPPPREAPRVAPPLEPPRPSAAFGPSEARPSAPQPEPLPPRPPAPPAAPPPPMGQAGTMRPGGPPQMLAELSVPTGPVSAEALFTPEPSAHAEPEPESGGAQPRSTLAGFGPAGPTAPPHAELLGVGASLSVPERPVEALPAPGRVGRVGGRAGMGLPPSVNPAFERAQAVAVQRLMEGIERAALPMSYPPDRAAAAETERTVDRVLDGVAAEGALDGVDRRELMTLLTHELVGLGPLEVYLDDPSTTDVFVNGPKQVFVRRGGQTRPGGLTFSSPETLDLVAHRLVATGHRVDEHLTTLRLSDGARLDVLLPPASAQGPAITVRKAPSSYRTLEQLIEGGALSHQMATFLRQAVDARRTLLVAGPPGAGKTELLHALGAGIEDGVRIVTVEQTAMVKLPQHSVLNIESADLGAQRGRAIEYALRLRPDRLLVDNLGPENAYAWILGAAFATMGSIATITGNGERDALTRLEALAIPGTPLHSVRGVREQIARAVHFMVVLGTSPSAGRVVKLVEVQGLELDALRLQDVFYYQPGGDEQGGAFHPTGHIPAFYEELRRSGVGTDLSIFRT